jgi:hypothetical protein
MNKLMADYDSYSPRRCAKIERFIINLLKTAEENDGYLSLDK